MKERSQSVEATEDRRWARILFCLVAIIIAFIPFIYPADRCLGDNGGIDGPNRLHAARIARQGVFPLWTDQLMAGFPIFADSQAGILYPTFPLFVLLPFPKTLEAAACVHVILNGLGMAYYLRRHCRSRFAIAAGSSFFMIHMATSINTAPGQVMTLGWTPWVLGLMDRAKAGSRSAPWGAAVINALSFLPGHSQITLMGYLATSLYFLFTPHQSLSRTLRQYAIMFFVPVFIVLPQLLPLYEYYSQSQRDSLPIQEHVAQWAMPTPVTVVYGLLLLVSYGSATRRAGSRRIAHVWGVIGLAGLLTASNTWLTTLAYQLPILSWFRWPAAYGMLTLLAVNKLGAIGLDHSLIHPSHAGTGRPLRSTVAFLTGAILLGLAGISTYWTVSTFVPRFYERGQAVLLDEAKRHPPSRLFVVIPQEKEFGVRELGKFEIINRFNRAFADSLRPNFNVVHNVDVMGLYAEHGTVCPKNADQFDAVLMRLTNPQLFRAAAVSHLVSPKPLFADHLAVGETRWRLAHDTSAGARQEATADGGLRLSPTLRDPQSPWKIRLERRGLPLRAGANYRWILRVRSDAPRPIHLVVVPDSSKNASAEVFREIAVGPEWSQVVQEFSPKRTSSSATLQLQLAASDVPVELTEASLWEGDRQVDSLLDLWKSDWAMVQDKPITIYRAVHAPTRAWMVYSTHVISNEESRLAFLEREPVDFTQTAIVETPMPTYIPPSIPPQVHNRQPWPGCWQVDVNTASAGLCVLSMRFDHHLQATLNGQPVRLHQVNHTFTGIEVPEGSHALTVVYRLPYFNTLLLISGLTTVLSLGLWQFLPGEAVES